MTKKYTRADFEPLSEAEEELLETGRFFGSRHCPELKASNNALRGKLIRAVLLEQIENVEIHESGLLVCGAFISDNFSLQSQKCEKMIAFHYCQFSSLAYFGECELNLVYFDHCEFLQNLNFKGSFIRGGLSIKESKIHGLFSLTAAQLGFFVDDKTSWPEKGKLYLRGAKYGEFQGASPTSARERLEWLSRMPEFHPQPYRQLAKVMREAGQDQDARDVLYEMEWLRARAQKFKTAETVAYLRQGGGDALPIEKERYHGKTRMVSAERLISTQFFRNILNWCFDTVIGYGYKIERALKLTLGMIALLAVLASVGYHTGYMAPNSAPVLVSKAWLEIDDPVEWAGSDHAKDWETFFAPIYAADVVLPLVDFGQESAWAPTTRGFLGYVLWAIRWPLKLMGWLIISLSIATMTGVVQRRHDT